VRRLLERQFGEVRVAGEISNLRIQGSGHVYFSLKDTRAQLACVLFRGEARGLDRDLLKDGQGVVVSGPITVYEARGQYQLRVLSVELQGVGALQLAFERLKQKLHREGLFAAERKRPLPRFIHRIGVITSATAAAFKDVVHVIRRRNPGLELILAPCRVQGREAAGEMASALRLLNEWSAVDVRDGGRGLDLVLLTRGGGSLEDLWAFNEEILARSIFESALPVVSAVGHEIDFTISDFVADLRCATPSVAAEVITQGVFASRETVFGAPVRLCRLVRLGLRKRTEQLGIVEQRVRRAHPRRVVEDRWQRLDDLRAELDRNGRRRVRECDVALRAALLRLQRLRPMAIVARRREVFERLEAGLLEQATAGLRKIRERLTAAEMRLRLLSPLNVLERGYSITTDAETGKVIHSSGSVQAGQRLRTRVRSGEIASVVVPPEGR
jgi:exodeoxyribonuclease VII large subunit